MITPWGDSDSITEIAEGIHFVTTPGHGGFKLSHDVRQAMPEHIRNHPTFAGGNWYEEDCDAALVIVSFPGYFGAAQVKSANEMLASSFFPKLN